MIDRENKFQPNGLATAIGSFPHQAPEEAVDLIFNYLPEAPAWPQLPRRDFRENMCVQFSRGMPALVLDPEKERIYFQVGDDLLEKLEAFYRKVIEDELDYFALTDEYALGFRYFLNRLQEKSHFPFLKGCVTGPVTFGLTVTDQNRKPSLYYPELFDAITKTITQNARWQIKQLSPFCQRPILFVDEPYLASVGSALVSLKEEEVVLKLNEVIAGIHRAGAISGVHCCANTDWSILMKTDVDILSFDAYGYAKNLLLYSGQIRAFIDRGGFLAWGIVPSSDEVEKENFDSLLERLFSSWKKLEEEGFTRKELEATALITPSCGMGTLDPPQSEKIMRINLEISRRIRS
jgi:hypothetical protein